MSLVVSGDANALCLDSRFHSSVYRMHEFMHAVCCFSKTVILYGEVKEGNPDFAMVSLETVQPAHHMPCCLISKGVTCQRSSD